MILSTPFRDPNSRLRALAWLLGAAWLLLLAALWRVQVAQAEHYGGREQAQSLRRIRLPAARGEIVDRHGALLAGNRPSYDIVMYLEQLPRNSKRQDITQVANASLAELRRTLGMSVVLTDQDIRNHSQRRRPIPMPVWRDVRPEQVAAFVECANKLPGVDLIVTPVREYPHGTLAAHVLGYTSRANSDDEEELKRYYYYQPDSVGQQGVERACDEYLRGSPGGRTIRVGPGGAMAGEIGLRDATRGGRVTLTIDLKVQQIVERALARAAVPGKELRGAAVALNARTGEVLAMVSLPSFDPNIFTPGALPDLVTTVLRHPGSPMINRAIGASYAPGSTFKPVTLLAGLQVGAIHLQDPAVCRGSMRIGNWERPFRCWSATGHGRVDALAAMRQSCDVWFYQEGMKTGVDAIVKVAREFGLGQATGLDIGSERSGVVPDPTWKRASRKERWWDGDTAQLSIGQSFLLVTPMQMACVAQTLANRGTSLRPYVVKRIQTADGQVVHEGMREVRGILNASADQIEAVRQTMRGVVQDDDGTARAAAVKGLTVAGKTGTAEHDTPHGRINRAWFIGFAPYEDPLVAVAVLVEDGVGGGHTAAPVAGEILAGLFGKETTGVSGGGD